MNPAPASFLASTCFTFEEFSPRYRSSVWTPGMPKIVSTSYFSSKAINASPQVVCCTVSVSTANFGMVSSPNYKCNALYKAKIAFTQIVTYRVIFLQPNTTSDRSAYYLQERNVQQHIYQSSMTTNRFYFLLLAICFFTLTACSSPSPDVVIPEPAAEDAAGSSQLNPNPPDPSEIEDQYSIAADLLNMSREELLQVTQSGQSIAQVATDRGVDPQVIIDALIAADHAMIDQISAESGQSADEISAWKTEAIIFQNSFVHGVQPTPLPADYGDGELIIVDEGPIEAYDPFQIAADLIGIEVAGLWAELGQGKTMADIANERNVEPQLIIDALLIAQDQEINALLAAGEISEDDAGLWRTDSVTAVTEMVTTAIFPAELGTPEECLVEDGETLPEHCAATSGMVEE